MITVIRLKADNYDCWVSEEAYQELRLLMSTGDFHTHRTKTLEVTPDQLENLKFHSGKGFLDFIDFRDGEPGNCWYWYDGSGDCVVEEVI